MCYTECSYIIKEGKKIKDLFETPDRFETFVLLIDSVHKSIGKIKQRICVEPKIKSVHTLWLYVLHKNKGGLTATELADKTNVDRSLVSREIRELYDGGYVHLEFPKGKRIYNARITLTEQGMQLADSISEAALEIQCSVSHNIQKVDLEIFYNTLNKISDALEGITESDNESV